LEYNTNIITIKLSAVEHDKAGTFIH